MTTEQKATPRPAWEVLREAAEIILNHGPWGGQSAAKIAGNLADKLEAVAPKPPTLAEAVRAYSQKLDSGASEVGAEYAAMMDALSRAEAGQ